MAILRKWNFSKNNGLCYIQVLYQLFLRLFIFAFLSSRTLKRRLFFVAIHFRGLHEWTKQNNVQYIFIVMFASNFSAIFARRFVLDEFLFLATIAKTNRSRK